jgi:hypothetical protein
MRQNSAHDQDTEENQNSDVIWTTNSFKLGDSGTRNLDENIAKRNMNRL